MKWGSNTGYLLILLVTPLVSTAGKGVTYKFVTDTIESFRLQARAIGVIFSYNTYKCKPSFKLYIVRRSRS